MVMEAPKKKCPPVSRLWPNLDGSLWQRQWLALRHPPPLWTGQDGRPILGTSVDTRILPPHLSDKESLLLLSQWIRIRRDDRHIRHEQLAVS